MKSLKIAGTTIRYVPRDDRALPPEEQTTFLLTPLTLDERAGAYDTISTTVLDPSGTQTQRSGVWRQSVELFVTHVIGIENFPAGAPEPWPATREARLTYMEQIDILIIGEVATVLRDAAAMPATAGN